MRIYKSPLEVYGQPLELGQIGHISQFNEEGRVMASMPDFYLAGKSEDPETLSQLEKMMEEDNVITSTRIIYHEREGEEAHLEGTIIHYYGSTVISPIKEPRIVIPIYNWHVGYEEYVTIHEEREHDFLGGEVYQRWGSRSLPSGFSLQEILKNDEGLLFLQALFHTNDSGDTIRNTISKLFYNPPNRIEIMTSLLEKRSKYPNQGVCLCTRDNKDNTRGLVNTKIIRDTYDSSGYAYEVSLAKVEVENETRR